ncbi:RIP homotypic interaction motif-containing protein [Halomonas elongata]|uniref:RIP homotypic interaction motif-containing protein n=1 Tax=Halomonas elongata TaxID=2746 RepID=UPI0023AEC54E|nr:RIP homotypic interaction motif-containing protein [Halomonas elongata]
MKGKIEKVIFNKLRELPSNKALLWTDLQVAFDVATGESIGDHLDKVQAVADELEGSDYARFEELPNGMPRITRGVDFDKWEQKMNPGDSGSHLNIESLNAQNVQVGDQNTMNVNITPEEFIDALERMQNDPEKAKSVLSQLNDFAKQGLSFGQTVAKFVGLMS